VAEYAVLAALWLRALATAVAAAWPVALAASVVTAILDEVHQATTRSRGGSPVDVLVDAAGAGAALLVLVGGRAGLDRVIASLLWIAAAGGAAMIAVNWAAGAPVGWLAVSAPAAAVALVLWRRQRARAPRDHPPGP
jgi:hypothetical protein